MRAVLTSERGKAYNDQHMFVKPNVTRVAAMQYGFTFHYHSHPGWTTYSEVLELAGLVRRDLRDLAVKDMIDIQSFLWVQGSESFAVTEHDGVQVDGCDSC